MAITEQNWQMLIEVAIFATGVYLVLRFLRETRGSGVIRGLTILLLAGILCFVTMIALLDLKRLGIVFKQVGTLAGVGLIVIFQPEIRRAIVKLGDSWVFRRFLQRDVKIVSRLLRSVARLSRDNIGALVAIEREGSLSSLAETGINIDAELNSYLIESVFYPGSALHDGAIIIRDDRIVAASCLLPLSQNPDVDKRLGTRHRAALGLAEETDALAIVVSEETGKVSAALDGQLQHGITLEELEHMIESSMRDTGRSRPGKAGKKGETERKRLNPLSLFRDPWRKLASIALGMLMWFVLDTQVTETAEIPISVTIFSQGSAAASNSLAVRMPSDAFDYRDTVDEKNAATDVRIFLGGPANLIDRARSAKNFLVTGLNPNKVEGVENLYVVSLTVDNIEHSDPELSELIRSIAPATVRVLLTKTGSKTVRLTSNNLETDGNDSQLWSRVLQDTVKFEPAELELRAPVDILEGISPQTKLLKIRVENQEVRDGRIIIVPTLVGPDGVTPKGIPQVSYEVEPAWEEHLLRKVPVVLDLRGLPAADQAKYQFTPEKLEVDVKIQASEALKRELFLAREESREQWIRAHARLRIYLGDNPFPANQDSQPLKARLTIENFSDRPSGGFIPNRDFKADSLPTITVTRKAKGGGG